VSAVQFALIAGSAGLFLLPARGAGNDQRPHTVPSAVRREVSVPIPNFSLTDQSGRPFRFESLRGKVIVVGFVYTSCPDVCPLITAAMRRVQTGLSDRERARVFFLSITTDPEVDVPEVLNSYGRRHGINFSRWAFLTGAQKALHPVWRAFGVKVVRKARGLVDHTSLAALVDQRGTMRVGYTGTFPDDGELLKDLRSLLAREQTDGRATPDTSPRGALTTPPVQPHHGASARTTT